MDEVLHVAQVEFSTIDVVHVLIHEEHLHELLAHSALILCGDPGLLALLQFAQQKLLVLLQRSECGLPPAWNQTEEVDVGVVVVVTHLRAKS